MTPSPLKKPDTELEPIIKELNLIWDNEDETYYYTGGSGFAKEVPMNLLWKIWEREERLILETENAVLEKAHQPCECGESHYGTPVRSVQGNITTFCQFRRIVIAELTDKKERG